MIIFFQSWSQWGFLPHLHLWHRQSLNLFLEMMCFIFLSKDSSIALTSLHMSLSSLFTLSISDWLFRGEDVNLLMYFSLSFNTSFNSLSSSSNSVCMALIESQACRPCLADSIRSCMACFSFFQLASLQDIMIFSAPLRRTSSFCLKVHILHLCMEELDCFGGRCLMMSNWLKDTNIHITQWFLTWVRSNPQGFAESLSGVRQGSRHKHYSPVHTTLSGSVPPIRLRTTDITGQFTVLS